MCAAGEKKNERGAAEMGHCYHSAACAHHRARAAAYRAKAERHFARAEAHRTQFGDEISLATVTAALNAWSAEPKDSGRRRPLLLRAIDLDRQRMKKLFTVATDHENITHAWNAYSDARVDSERSAPLLHRVLAMEAIRKIGTFEAFRSRGNDIASDYYDAIRDTGTPASVTACGYYKPSKMQTWRELLEDVSAVH